MKLWKKIYLITLILFLILINGGIYLAFHMTYKKDIEVEQNRAQSAFEMVCSSLTRNMESLQKDNQLGNNQMKILLTTYERYYSQQEITLKCWKGDAGIITGKDEKLDKTLFDEKKEIVKVFTNKDIKAVSITKIISDFDEKYYIYYEQPLYQLTETWNELQRSYIVISFMFSVMLAVILLIVLRRLTKPIDKLSDAVNKMKEGYYINPKHVDIKGNDDIARLGEQFNDMADTISDSILQIKEESEKKQQFIDNFAHELKSPLTSIYGFAEYVGKANISEDEREECMRFIMEESDRMLKLSYTLLNLAKLRGTDLQKSEIRTSELCAKIEKHIKPKLKEKNIEFVKYIESKEIYGNEILFISLIRNLIINGINACEENGKIELSIYENTKEYKITVVDNGCGMTSEEVKHILEPFYRVDKARSRNNGGTGLGLSLCNQIAIAHNGTITFETKRGAGTKVIVSINKA